MMKKIGFLFMLVFLAATGMSVLGQDASTDIRGVITLPDSLPAVNARVIARHDLSGSLYAAMADSAGAYSIPSVPIGGPFTLQVTLDGYEPYSKEGIYLTLKLFTLDVCLTRKEGKNVKNKEPRLVYQSRDTAINRRHRAR